ncbi:Protein NLRC5 [Holothuria leucospilota]|uniref:Protein NLRC5 n=1 Tax=Holothuria leucospilota TaxID=206669 RepID=A0A9Q1BWY0_HOLLE|nr:Protein NLRC5 [Holothuria leucospilota]
MSSDEIKELRKYFIVLDTEKDQSSEYGEDTIKKKNLNEVLTILKERGILYPDKANQLKTLFDNLGCLTTSKLSGPIRLYQKFANIFADMPQHDQPTVNAGSLNDSVSVSPSHEIPEARFFNQATWQNLNLLIKVVNFTHGLVCYIRSGKKREPNVLTQLFKLPSLDSSDNPQVIFSKVISRQGDKKLFLTFIDETHLVMCYNKTLEIVDVNSKEVVRGHQLRAAARAMDVDEGEIFIVVGDFSAVLVFNQNLEEIRKLTFTLKDWKYPADMKVTSERLFIICKVKPRDHEGSSYWPDRAVSFRREDGEIDAYYTFPREQYAKPVSIAAHKESEIVGVLWSELQSVSGRTSMVSLHTLSGCYVFLLDVEHSHIIQILNRNTMIVINQTDGLKFYNMAHFFTFNIMAIRLSSLITQPECTGLQNFYGISDDEINRKDSGSSQFGNLTSSRRRILHLLKILEEKDLVGPSKFDDFIAADAKVCAHLRWSHVEAYLKLQAETGVTLRASLKAGPSEQVQVPVTQEGGAENLVSVSCQKGTSAQLQSLYPGGIHPHPRGSTSLQPQKQYHQQLEQQAKQQAQQHDQELAAAFQGTQVTQQQPTVTLEQQAHQHDQENAAAFQGTQVTQQQPTVTLEQQTHQYADQQALRQQYSLLHQQQLYQQQWQQNQAYQEQLQVHQERLGYNQVQQYQQPVGYSYSLGLNQPQAAFAQKPPFQQFFNRPTAFHRQQLPALYNQYQGVLYNQQQAAYNAPVYSQLPGGSSFVQHQQEQYATLPYQQQHHELQMQQQELQQYPPYQPQTLQHQVVAPSHDELGQYAFAEQMTGRQRTVLPSSSQHHQQGPQYQPRPGPLPVIEGSIVRDKRSLFVEFLKKKITSLSEMNYFTPWEKSSRWKSTDLFVSCWLTLNDRKSMASVKNIEDQCKLKYIEIFTHDRLKSETRIVIEEGPGTGKTMLLSQLAFDWAKGKIEHVDILIFLPLKIVKDKTLIQAIREFYIPENTPLSGNDIADILASNEEKICLLLDGLEEYSGGGKMRAKESSDVRKVMKKEKYPNCKVVVTCHSYLKHDLPLLKIGQFGETERNSYIEKLSLKNIKKEEKMKQVIEDDSFLLGLSSIPLLFALTVHNIESMSFAGDCHFDKVAPFMKNVVETLCASSMSGHETWSEKEQLILGELAFNGLYKSQQQFSWPKDFIETKISRLKQWLDCRILVLERDMKVPGTEFQDIAENYEKHDFEKMEHVTEKIGTSQSLAQGETQQYKEDRQGRETQSNETTVEVRFLHETIQEWFAATYLCSMMNSYTDEDQFHEYVINQLNQLSPKDLHYVLRFTSYLHPRSCHAIINYLLTNFLSDDGSIDSHVMDCICLCFAEHNDIKGTDIKNSVTEVCKEVMITIDVEDGRFLQKAKSSLLEYASNCGVIIKEIELRDVISAVDETSLTLNSGIKLPQLNTLEVIEVSQWDQALHQDDFQNILKFLSKGSSIKTILCVFPCHPPKIVDEVIIENVISKNLEVEWKNGEVIWTLDPKKQIFIPIPGTMRRAGQMELKNKEDDFMSNEHFLMSLPGTSSAPFGKWSTKRPLSKMFSDMKLDIASKRLKEEPSTSYAEEKIVKEETPSQSIGQVLMKEETAESNCEQKLWAANPATAHEQSQDTVSSSLQLSTCICTNEVSSGNSYTSRKTIITKDGGTVEISKTGILLVIPPNALPADKEEHEIFIRCILRRSVEDQVKCFSSNSTAVVEILPNLSLLHPVRLSLPHCLVLQQNLKRKAKIFASHHEKGTHPVWEEHKDVPYHVEDTTCIILLNSFSWYKYCIDDEIVIAKKIVVYAAAERPEPDGRVVRMEVGCYPDLPGQEEDIPGGQNLIVAHKKILYFVKSEMQHPLQISLKDIFPSEWQCRRSSEFTDSLSKKIPYRKISKGFGDSCVYILEKPRNAAGMPLCVFTISQEKDVEIDNLAVQLAVNFQVIHKVPLTTGVTEHQCKSSLKAETTVTKSGGELEIPGTGVALKIPPNALEGNIENHLVGMRIIPSRIIEDQVTSLSSNACTAVEVYPHTISLRQPMELCLPHCLNFYENSDLNARIFTMYLKGSPAKWEKDTKLTYKLDEKACVITLNKPCCVQYFIDDKIVEDKKIRVYTAAKKLEHMDKVAELEVGFYSDIPGGGELLRMNPNFTVDSKKLLFMGKEKSSLQLSLDDIAPSLWECWFPKFPKDKPQNIPVGAIAASIEHSNLYILKKTSNEAGIAICTFRTLPKEGPMSLEMALSVCPQVSFLPGSEGQASGRIYQEHGKKLETDSENLTMKLLSRKLKTEWKDVCRSLGVTDGELYREEENNKGNIKEAIYQCLLSWKQNKADEATFETLRNALAENGRSDLAKDIEKYEELFPKQSTAS